MPELFLYVSFLLPHQRFDIPLAAHDHQSLSLCEHVLRPRHGEQVPSMADGQDIDIVAIVKGKREELQKKLLLI